MDGWDVLIAALTVVAAFVFQLLLTVVLIWFERRGLARMQVRIGPNRAGPFGLLQTVADGIKLFFKESFVPRRADRAIYELAPLISMAMAFLGFAVIPFGPGFSVHGHQVNMQVANLNVGVLWVLSVSSVSVYGVMLAGWSSGSKYPLLGGVRASAQVISYEAAMGLSIVSVVIWAGTLSTKGIVEAQATYRWYGAPLVIPFLFFCISGFAETNRAPFDLVEAESELVGGFHTEYSGIRFALFYMAEYINMITISAMAVTLFLGGYNGPAVFGRSTAGLVIAGFLWFLIKTCVMLVLFVWIRATLPRLRYDQLMTLGWKWLIPVNLGYMMLVALFVALQERGTLLPGFFH